MEPFPAKFVGRQYELAALGRMLQAPRPRLIGIIGPQGIGKTRLALQALACYKELTGGQTCFIPLHHTTLTQAALSAATATSLLVLDGWSGHMDWEQALIDMLPDLPAARVLITARRLPPLPGLVKLRLDGLPVPPPEQHADLETNPAVALYLAAVRQANPAFVPTPTELEAASRICRDSCGVPELILQSAFLAEKKL